MGGALDRTVRARRLLISREIGRAFDGTVGNRVAL